MSTIPLTRSQINPGLEIGSTLQSKLGLPFYVVIFFTLAAQNSFSFLCTVFTVTFVLFCSCLLWLLLFLLSHGEMFDQHYYYQWYHTFHDQIGERKLKHLAFKTDFKTLADIDGYGNKMLVVHVIPWNNPPTTKSV